MFDNGACVHRPDGCKEVYYFPPRDANDSNAGCSAFSKAGYTRIDMLRKGENVVAATTDPRLLIGMTQESDRNTNSVHSQEKETEPSTKPSTEQDKPGITFIASHHDEIRLPYSSSSYNNLTVMAVLVVALLGLARKHLPSRRPVRTKYRTPYPVERPRNGTCKT